MFMHMLGYPTHFGQMETLKLIASNGFPEKRLGYLGLMILLDERQEVLMLVTNSLKNDLNSNNQYIVGLALTALGNIASTEMARDLAPEVERLLSSSNPYIRKKAALCARRVLRKIPDMLEIFVDRAAECLNDRNHAVVLTGITLMQEISDVEPATIAIFRDQVPTLCRILRSLVVGGFSAEYDVGGISDPFLQVSILRLLRILGQGSTEASDAMSDVLAQVATNTESTKTSGNAILYECVRTIMAVESIGGLRVLAVNILGRFLAHRDNNIRYVALNTLAKVVAIDPGAVQRHRTTVVECVKDPDLSIRRSALELVYALVNEGNVVTLSAELLEYLKVSDSEFKPDLTSKICSLVQRFAPDKRWYIDCMVRVLLEAGHYVTEEPCHVLMVAILNEKQLHGYATRTLYKGFLSQGVDAAAPSLIAVAVWCIGEYGEILLSGNGMLEGESEAIQISGSDIVDELDNVLENRELPPACREYTLTALAKLSTRLPNESLRIQRLLARHANAVELETQTRSVEYGKLFEYSAIKGEVLQHIPAVEETAYDASLEASEGEKTNSNAAAAVDLAELLGLDVHGGASGGKLQGKPQQLSESRAGDNVTALQNLLGGLDIPPDKKPTARFIAYEDENIQVAFSLQRGDTKGLTNIVAEVSNKTSQLITEFTLQAAVPKFMSVKLQPASGSTLSAVGTVGNRTVTQNLQVTNTMDGEKPLIMRLKMMFNRGGDHLVKLAEVKNFPTIPQSV